MASVQEKWVKLFSHATAPAFYHSFIYMAPFRWCAGPKRCPVHVHPAAPHRLPRQWSADTDHVRWPLQLPSAAGTRRAQSGGGLWPHHQVSGRQKCCEYQQYSYSSNVKMTAILVMIVTRWNQGDSDRDQLLDWLQPMQCACGHLSWRVGFWSQLGVLVFFTPYICDTDFQTGFFGVFSRDSGLLCHPVGNGLQFLTHIINYRRIYILLSKNVSGRVAS